VLFPCLSCNFQTIKKTRVPIICICNDKYSQKLKSLKGHCIELDFRK
jgi:replication factor C subunit 1